jgi:hypothetical protein
MFYGWPISAALHSAAAMTFFASARVIMMRSLFGQLCREYVDLFDARRL